MTIYVADQGIGIPAEEQARIFERFHRVESSLHRSTEGTGLGLYLVKAVVEAHGGSIWVESAPGRGSIFIFTLPRK
jgi:signal transduction histidine kinase